MTTNHFWSPSSANLLICVYTGKYLKIKRTFLKRVVKRHFFKKRIWKWFLNILTSTFFITTYIKWLDFKTLFSNSLEFFFSKSSRGGGLKTSICLSKDSEVSHEVLNPTRSTTKENKVNMNNWHYKPKYKKNCTPPKVQKGKIIWQWADNPRPKKPPLPPPHPHEQKPSWSHPKRIEN